MNKKKLLQKRWGSSDRTAYDSMMEELKVLRQLEHPNTVYLREVIDDPKGDIFIVTDYYSRGSLGDKMKEINKEFSNQKLAHKAQGTPF